MNTTDELIDVFAHSGEVCADEQVLDEAFVELARKVPPETLGRALCTATADHWGLCPRCGHMFDDGGHQPGCPPWGSLFMIVRVVVACWRSARWHIRSAVLADNDRRGTR